MKNYTHQELVEIANFPINDEPYLNGEGEICAGKTPMPYEIISINHARRYGAQLLLLAQQAEEIEEKNNKSPQNFY